jgi:hypothetical protein
MTDWETPLYRLLQTVDWKKEVCEQLEALKKFDNLPQAQFDELTSGKYIKSEEAGIVMQYLPRERFLDKIPSLLGHLMDGNWPAAWRVATVVASLGEPVIPEIKRVFNDNKTDSLWLSNIIHWVLQKWDTSLVLKLKYELIEQVSYADEEGAAIGALQVLQGRLASAEFMPLYQGLRTQYAGSSNLLNELEEALES